MTNKVLERKIYKLEKDLALVKRMYSVEVKKNKKSAKKEVLSDWAIRQIKLGQADVKAGRVYSLEAVKEMIGLK